jgi:hypothetical protein
VGRDRTADTRIFSPLLYRLSYRTISYSIPIRLNRAAKIGDNPNKKAKNLKRIPVFRHLLEKKASRFGGMLLAYSLFMPLLQSLILFRTKIQF